VSLDDDQHAPLKSPILSSQSQEETVTYTIDAGKVKGRIIALLDEILGTSERRVFQARVMTDNEPARLHELAKEMGVSSERVNQLEASAKRKITVALAKIGYLQPDLEAILRATRVRAPRQKSTSQPVPQKELAAAE
jgi:DNA-directed RNA polymerase sigma subunit (sigma70/sigma32)